MQDFVKLNTMNYFVIGLWTTSLHMVVNYTDREKRFNKLINVTVKYHVYRSIIFI
jgi:hypothetical protein